jgi:hypothetical protein
MNIKLIVIGIAVLFLAIGLSGCIVGPRYYIEAERVDEEPDFYINMTEQLMGNYPYIKKAIELDGNYTQIPLGEKNKVEELLENYDTYFIKYQDEYYEIGIAYSD